MEKTITILSPKYDYAIINNNDNLNDISIKIEGFNNIGKVFTGDEVSTDGEKCMLLKSNIKRFKIVGILELYSKYKYAPNKRGIERFKFTPVSKNYPEFLVSTKLKRKYTKNILVTIKFLEWKKLN